MTELDDLINELQEPEENNKNHEKSESVPENATKKTKSLTVTQTIEKYNELKEKSNAFSEDPELVDPELDKLEKETKKKLYKLGKLKEIEKMNEQIKRLESGEEDSHQPVLTPNERTYVNFPVPLLEKFVDKSVFYELPSYVQEIIVNKIEKDKEEKRLAEQEKQRLIQVERDRKIKEEKDRLIREEQAKKAKEEQIRRTYNPCPYCQQRTVNKKVLIKGEQAQCENPQCNRIVNYCQRCKSIVDDDHLHEEDVEFYLNFREKYEQVKQQRQQKYMLKRQQQLQEDMLKQQQQEEHIIDNTPSNLTDAILGSRFAQAAMSKAPETIEVLRKTIGDQRTEQLADILIRKVKKV